MAAIIKRALGVDTKLVSGGRGEFTIWLDDRKVYDKGHGDFPDEAAVLAAVRSPA